MKRNRGKTGLGGVSAGLVLAGAALALSLPTAGLALGGFEGETVSIAARGSFGSFTPASVDPELARLLADRNSSKARLMRFTPAGAPNRPDRSVTVAIRVDAETARAISVRSAIASAQGEAGRGPGAIVLAPTRFNLGVARGYKSFAQPITLPDVQRIDMPDLATFAPQTDQSGSSSRFSARILLDEKGQMARSHDQASRKSVDVAGSYRVLRNLDVTAGVRYSGRDRLDPLTDARQDSQAVYVGTQFRF